MMDELKRMWNKKWTFLKYFLIIFSVITHYGQHYDIILAVLNGLGLWGMMLIGEFSYMEKE